MEWSGREWNVVVLVETAIKPSLFCTLLTRCTIPCACHAKRHLNAKKWSVPVNFYAFDLDMCFAPQRRALLQPLKFQKWSQPGVLCIFWLGNVLRATTACTFSTSQLPKVVREWCVLYTLTWKFASRCNAVHFFDMSTSKSGRRRSVFNTSWLGNVLRATTACTFFNIATFKSGPRMVCFVHFDFQTCFTPQRTGGQFPMSHLTTWLRTRRFSKPTFRPSGATNQWKSKVNRDFPTFSRTCIFFLLTLSPLWSSLFFSSPLWLFLPLLFHLSSYCRKFDF